ncbi:unnamed protein product [Aureobasidium mustum]|uniref:Uncharacterized protein n=1 Tax=Aureobasidium mustum TaxID=2773714 RepID=A0A9N8PNC0_9PEZI|nr:unnamed protein product [Aureobasidium mustum]
MKREASIDAEGGPATKQARLSPSALDNDNIPSLEVKDATKTLFRGLCKEFGSTPTEPIRTKISQLLDIDPSESDLEPALFAFVQNLSFIWRANESALFIGVKNVKGRDRLIWYRPFIPGASVGACLWIDLIGPYHDDGLVRYHPPHEDVVDQVLVDRFWPSFTTAFGLTNEDGNYKYIAGVHTILSTFPRLRTSCTTSELRRWAEGRSTTATHYVPLRKYELPFLPESVWMSKPIGSQRLQPVTASEDSKSRPTTQPNSTTDRRASIRELGRIQSIISGQAGQRRQLDGIGEQQNRGKPEVKRHSVSETVERSPASFEINEAASEANTEVYQNITSESDRQSASEESFEHIDLTAVDHVNQLLQQNNIEVAFGTPHLTNGTAQANVQLTVTFPTRIRQQQPQPALQFSFINSIDTPPVLPSRRAALELLYALAMETVVGDT